MYSIHAVAAWSQCMTTSTNMTWFQAIYFQFEQWRANNAIVLFCQFREDQNKYWKQTG